MCFIFHPASKPLPLWQLSVCSLCLWVSQVTSKPHEEWCLFWVRMSTNEAGGSFSPQPPIFILLYLKSVRTSLSQPLCPSLFYSPPPPTPRPSLLVASSSSFQPSVLGPEDLLLDSLLSEFWPWTPPSLPEISLDSISIALPIICEKGSIMYVHWSAHLLTLQCDEIYDVCTPM